MHSDTHYRPHDIFTFLRNRGFGLPGLPVTIALLAVVGCEAAVFYGRVEYALWGYLLALVVCVLGPLRLEGDGRMLQALALVPVFRLVNLGMPVFSESTLYWLAMVYGPFIPAAYLITKSRSAGPLSFGGRPTRVLLLLPVVLPASAALGVAEYTLIRPDPLIPAWNGAMLLSVGVVMFGFVAVVEELLYRGVIQRVFEHQIGRWSGLLITSLLFGIMHSGYGVPHELLFATALGLLFGVVYDYTRSLLLVVLMHGTLDLFLFAVVPHHPWLVGYLFEFVPNQAAQFFPI